MRYFVYQFISERVEETEALASRLASFTPNGTIITLDGDLGAGKTAFTRGFASGLGIDARQVSSPTFTIKHEYSSDTAKARLNHFDVYRLETAEAFCRGGFQEAFTKEAISILEWAELVEAALPKDVWKIKIERLESFQDDLNWFNLANLDLSEQLTTKRTLTFVLPNEAIRVLGDFINEMQLTYLGEC